jgi:N-acetylglutamate synthase
VALTIRNMTANDLESVIALWNSVEGVGLDPVIDEPAGLASYLVRNPGLSFVAECDGRTVGAVLCGHDGRRGYLHHLAVAKAHRRQGFGRDLAGRCLAALERAGINKCHLFVFGDNEAAKTFWKSVGWQFREDLAVMSCGAG